MRVNMANLALLAVVTALSFCAVGLLITDVELFGAKRIAWGVIPLTPIICVSVWTSNTFFPVAVVLTGVALAIMLMSWQLFDMKPHLTIRRVLGIFSHLCRLPQRWQLGAHSPIPPSIGKEVLSTGGAPLRGHLHLPPSSSH